MTQETVPRPGKLDSESWEFEKDRFAACMIAQWLGLFTILLSYIILFGINRNKFYGLWVIVAAMSLIILTAYSEIWYRAIKFCGIKRAAAPQTIPVDWIIISLTAIDGATLLFVIQWLERGDRSIYHPLFLTILTVQIILQAPPWWIKIYIILVALVYGSSLFLDPWSIPVPIEEFYASQAHLVVLLFCLLVVFVEFYRMKEAEEKRRLFVNSSG